MSKSIYIPLVAMTMLVGCDDQVTATQQAKVHGSDKIEQKQIVPEWVGKYQGTTPCLACFARCEECPGMSVELTLNTDQSYVLSRLSLSGHNEIETLKGPIKFLTSDHSKIELVNVSSRNLLYVDVQNSLLEILEDQSEKPYAAADDFLLEKSI